MRFVRAFFIAIFFGVACSPSPAAEGPSIAGPIGGTDLRAALLPPPGLYAGGFVAWADAYNFTDGTGSVIPALSQAYLSRVIGGPFVYYVPNVQVLGGSVGFGALLPIGQQCGRLFPAQPKSCSAGIGDVYVEGRWARSFGTVRPSRYQGALPIVEGLTVSAGFGMVFPTGQYDPTDVTSQALSTGSHIWDFAPNVSFTYITPAWLGEGTEISAKLYWNNYLTNTSTQYSTGTLLNLDFAVSERFGRIQAGLAGIYLTQVADDKLNGVPVAPDGRRAESLALGGVLAYDMPELRSSIKIKAMAPVFSFNNIHSRLVVLSWITKFQ